MKRITTLLTMAVLLAGTMLITRSATAATKTWAVGGVNTNWSTLNNWSPAGVPQTGDDAVFSVVGATAYVTNTIPTTNNAVDSSFTGVLNSLAYNQTNSSHWTLITGPGLVVSSTSATVSPLFVGSGIDQNTSPALDMTAIMGTSLAITNTNAPIMIAETGQSAASPAVNRRATLNLSGLNNFTAKVQRLGIAWDPAGAVQQRRPTATLLLAKTNNITCTVTGTARVGSDTGIGYILAEVLQQAGNASTNRLGQVNVFNVNAMKFGGAKTANSYVDFNPGWTNPSVTFRNAAGTGRQTAWFIGDDSTTGASTSGSTAVVNLSAGIVDALVDSMYLGVGQNGTTASFVAGGNGTLSFARGTVDVNSLALGYQVYAGASAGRGVLNVLTNGLLVVNKDILMARNLGPGTGSLVTNSLGYLFVNAGEARVFGNIVDGGGGSTIIVTNNGTLDLKPSGDTVAGNIGVRVLSIGAGLVTNYATLNVSNLNILRPASQFTVYPGQTLGVVGPNLTGTLTVNSNLTLTNATLALDLGTPGGANDQVAVLASLDLQGTNTVLVNPISGFGPAAYPIVTYATGLTGDVSTNLKVGGAMGDSRYSLYFDTTTAANTITLNVSGGPAANLFWSGDGVGNVWNLHQTFNWSDGGGANNAKFYNLDTVTFDDSGSASPAVNLVTNLLPTSVTFSGTKNYTLAGTGKISGAANITYGSSGTLTLLATNDYTGTTYIASGTVQVGNGTTADGAIGVGQIDNYGALVFNSASYQSVPGIITGSGSITKRGPGVTQLSGISIFSAAVTNEAGTLMAGSGSAFGDTFYGTFINSGATLDLGGYSIGQEPVTVSGAGVGGVGAVVNSGFSAGSLQSLTLTGPTTFGGSSTWVIGCEPGLTGLVANTNKITKVGTSAVELSNGDFSGAVTDSGLGDVDVQAGTFILYGYVSLGDPTKAITVRSGATLEADNTGDSLTSKLINLDGGATFKSTLPNRLMPQYCTVPGPFTLGGAVTFNVVLNDTVFVTGELGGTGSLLNTGAGLLSLSASNSFTGNLTIQAGTVALTSDASVSQAANIVLAGGKLDVSGRVDSTLTLASGQSLKGSGTVIGTVISPAGSTVSPGASIGSITVSNDVTLRGATVMEISKSGSVKSGDLLAVSGTLDLGGTLTVTYSGDSLQAGDTFTLFTAGSFANSFSAVNLPVVAGVVWTNMTAIDGTIAVVSVGPPPQPSVSGAVQLPNGNFQINFSGPSGYGYSVLSSTNVVLPASSWSVVGGGIFSGSPVSFTDTNAPGYQKRFYMISIP